MFISYLLFVVALLCYLGAVAGVSADIFWQKPLKARLITLVGLIGGLAHLGGTLVQMHTPAGVDFSLVQSLSLIMAVTTLMVVIGSEKHHTRPLLLVVMPLSFLLILTGSLSTATRPPLEVHAGEAAHIILSILAFGVLTIATAEGLLLNFVSGRLKDHRLNPAIRHIPPVEALERLMFDLLRAGTLILLGAVVTGLVFLRSFAEQHLYHKFFFSILALVLFGWLWWGHQRYGWRGKGALRWTLAGYVSLLLAYAGNKIVLEWIIS